jgi:hypothetical protein
MLAAVLFDGNSPLPILVFGGMPLLEAASPYH